MDHAIWIAKAACTNWPFWVVSAILVLAAVIDGTRLRVPNWLTFPMILTGWLYSLAHFGWPGLGWSLGGTAVGFALLLPVYAIGGMGAGDVKLFAGVGAWVHTTHAFYALSAATIVGGVIAIGMVLYRRSWKSHLDQLGAILTEIIIIRDPTKLSAIASKRKSSMLILPYAIPIAIGTIVYFAWEGMLI